MPSTFLAPNFQLLMKSQPFSLKLEKDETQIPVFEWKALRVRKEGVWFDLSTSDRVEITNSVQLKFTSSILNEIKLYFRLIIGENLLQVELGSDDPSIEALSIDFTSQADEHYLGFGERFNRIDQRGQEVDLHVINAASGGLTYKPIPFFMSSAGYGVRLLTSYRTKVRLACYDDPGVVSIRTENNQLAFQLWTGKPFAELLTRYTQLLGKPLYQPPAWIFGPWKSRDWTAETQSTVEEDLRLQRQLNLPGTVKLIDAAWESQLNDFQFNENFPDPTGMITEARKLGYRNVLWIAPWMVWNDPPSPIYEFCAKHGFLIKDNTGQPYVHRLGNSPGFMGSCFDFTNPQAVEWWQSQIEGLVQMGFDGFKTDFGEQVPEDAVFYDGRTGLEMHNLYPQIYNQVTSEAMQRQTHGILLARSAWDGSQSYAAIWAGDQTSDFGPTTGLPSVIMAGQTAALSGFPFWASDIGGYFGQPTDEVFTRWIEFGAFSPIMQLHGLGCREPWKFSKEILEVYRYYARVHMDLFPYIYTYAQEASTNGIPIMRAMAFAFPEDPSIWQANAEFQYGFGRDLLVAPIYFSHTTHRYIYLPQGLWRNFWTGEVLDGGQEIVVQAELNQIPVLARAGAIIPLLDPSPDTLLPVLDEPEIKVAGNNLRLQIYPGADGIFLLYDGTQFSWQDSSLTLKISSQPVNRQVSIRVMDPVCQLNKVMDDQVNQIKTENTNLNGDHDHIRFQTLRDHTYQVIFK